MTSAPDPEPLARPGAGSQADGASPEHATAPVPSESASTESALVAPSVPAQSVPARREVTIRRAPKFLPFLLGGVLIGVVIAAFIGFATPEDPDYTRSAVFGFFAMILGAAGLFVGAMAVLVLDWISRRRAQTMTAEEVPDA